MNQNEIKNQVRQFYDQVGWKIVSEGIYQNARYEDLRDVSQEYIHKCHLRINQYLKSEGKYILDYKNQDSRFHKSIHISYPDEADKKRAKKMGVNPGGCIMIHGQKNGLGRVTFMTQRFNWTDGCIAVSNHAMDEIWLAVDVGTPIEIKP